MRNHTGAAMKTARTSSTSGVTQQRITSVGQTDARRRSRRLAMIAAAAAATLGGMSGVVGAATTHTWVGNFIDPSSGTGGPNGGGVSGTYTANPAVPGL